MLISLREYAKKHDKYICQLTTRARAGKFKTAQKIGNIWVIEEDEPLIDLRVTSGKYVGKSRNRKK